MRFYLLSPNGVPENPHLFPTMKPTFNNNGWTQVTNIIESQIVLFDLHTRISGYDQTDIEYILDRKPKLASFDEFDKGGMSTLDWPQPLTSQQYSVFQLIYTLAEKPIKSVHFCRLLNKTKTYPPNVFPFEKPILFEQPMLSADNLFNRPYDIVWIANTAPQREGLKQILEADGRLKCDIRLGQEKIPLSQWIDEHRKGKLFISWSGGGYSDEKMQHLFSVAGIIRENNNQWLAHDFVHLETAIRPSPIPTKEDLDAIYEIVNDKERLYALYRNGYDFMKKYYSKEYIAQYILNTIKENLFND
jgi:hypothetical protein